MRIYFVIEAEVADKATLDDVAEIRVRLRDAFRFVPLVRHVRTRARAFPLPNCADPATLLSSR